MAATPGATQAATRSPSPPSSPSPLSSPSRSFRAPILAALLGNGPTDDASELEKCAAPAFEMHTPMLVMPYPAFRAQGRIAKNVASFRKQAKADGHLVEFATSGPRASPHPHPYPHPSPLLRPPPTGRVAVFISHEWWDREYDDGSAAAGEATVAAARAQAAGVRAARMAADSGRVLLAVEAATSAKAAGAQAKAFGLMGRDVLAYKQAAADRALAGPKTRWQAGVRYHEVELATRTFDPDDKGAPDYGEGRSRTPHPKWRTICAAGGLDPWASTPGLPTPALNHPRLSRALRSPAQPWTPFCVSLALLTGSPRR